MSRVLSIVTTAAVAAAIAAGCGGTTSTNVRYVNQPPVWRVNDRKPLANDPHERPYYRTLYHLDGLFVRRTTRALDVRDPTRARDVNSVDEVPDSTWFTNRIGVRDMTIEEVRRGPNVDPSPFDHLPWKIVSQKVGGLSLGFVFEDARGEKYLLKFDKPDFPEMETGAHIIVQRILWACGYNVPQDHVGYVTRDDLQIAAKAVRKDVFGGKQKMTARDLDVALRFAFKTPDGRYRVLASKYVPGKPLGGYAREGTRSDDPNDRVRHEHRRSLRGQYAIFSWLNHTDLQEDNTLDAFVPDPADPDKKYIVHYLIDFGKALGVLATHNNWRTAGYTYRIDFGIAMKSLLAFGLWEQPWEHLETPPISGVGMYTAESFDPGSWRSSSQYFPFEDKDRFDAFWGAKILIRFTRDQLAAIVEEAQYTDPRATQYMTDALVARQRKTARYWFDKVAPLDAFELTPDDVAAGLCFDDLMLRYRLANVLRGTRYHVDSFDYRGRATGFAVTVRPGQAGRSCVRGVALGNDHDQYTIVRLRVQRSGRMMPAVTVHVARDLNGRLAVIGVRRE